MGKIGFVPSEGRNYFIVSLQSLLLNTLRNKFCSRYNLLKMLNTKNNVADFMVTGKKC